jgi:hypothetical protein
MADMPFSVRARSCSISAWYFCRIMSSLMAEDLALFPLPFRSDSLPPEEGEEESSGLLLLRGSAKLRCRMAATSPQLSEAGKKSGLHIELMMASVSWMMLTFWTMLESDPLLVASGWNGVSPWRTAMWPSIRALWATTSANSLRAASRSPSGGCRSDDWHFICWRLRS